MRPSASDPGAVARRRVADAVDLAEHARGRVGIVVVAEREPARDRQHAVFGRTRARRRARRRSGRARCPSPRTSSAPRRCRGSRSDARDHRFRGTECVDDRESRDPVEQRLLARGAERHARRHDRAQRRPVERATSSSSSASTSGRANVSPTMLITATRSRVDQPPQLGRVEALVVAQHDGAATVQRRRGHAERGRVHER